MRALLMIVASTALLLSACRGGTTINNFTLPPNGAPSPVSTQTAIPNPPPPTASATPTANPTSTSNPTPTANPTPTPNQTPTPKPPTPKPPTPTPKSTATPTPTPTPTATPKHKKH